MERESANDANILFPSCDQKVNCSERANHLGWCAWRLASGENASIAIHQKRYIMANMNGKQVVSKLKEAGWVLSRIEGSHNIMEKKGMPRCVPVPVHGSKDLGSGVISAIQRQTGVKLR